MKNMNRGKMVYCQETFQIFPSAKVAAEHQIAEAKKMVKKYM